jgi:hypothetical protein
MPDTATKHTFSDINEIAQELKADIERYRINTAALNDKQRRETLLKMLDEKFENAAFPKSPLDAETARGFEAIGKATGLAIEEIYRSYREHAPDRIVEPETAHGAYIVREVPAPQKTAYLPKETLLTESLHKITDIQVQYRNLDKTAIDYLVNVIVPDIVAKEKKANPTDPNSTAIANNIGREMKQYAYAGLDPNNLRGTAALSNREINKLSYDIAQATGNIVQAPTIKNHIILKLEKMWNTDPAVAKAIELKRRDDGGSSGGHSHGFDYTYPPPKLPKGVLTRGMNI